MVAKSYDFPVYGTQGGGLARRSGGLFFFIEAPDCPGLDIGDAVPAEWDITAANSLARKEVDRFTSDPQE